MAELVDATDLKSVGTLLPCRFDSGFPHHKVKTRPCDGFFVLLTPTGVEANRGSASECAFVRE